MASENASVVNPHSDSINQKTNTATFADILEDIAYWIQYVLIDILLFLVLCNFLMLYYLMSLFLGYTPPYLPTLHLSI